MIALFDFSKIAKIKLKDKVTIAVPVFSGLSSLKGMMFWRNGSCLLNYGYVTDVHTFFMRYPIHIVFFNKEGKVFGVDKNIKPFMVVAPPNILKMYVLELDARTFSEDMLPEIGASIECEVI